MGEYSSGTIKNGASPCYPLISRFRIVFVCVILKQNSSLEKVGTQNTQLLGTLTGALPKALALLIEGLATSKNPLMTLKPNDTNSVYIDYETEDDSSPMGFT